MEPDVFIGPYNPIVVNTGQKLVLIDTGTGEAAFQSTAGSSGDQYGAAAASILRRSIPSSSRTITAITNGLLKADGSLAFANAEILVPAGEHKF
jgi:hypothetical protein